LRESDDPRFIPGRVAEVRGDTLLGVFGEVHPRVLDAWGIQVPCTAAEIDIERLMATDAEQGDGS
jgi:phenylalanyl-tRNA synthetase beta chain